MIWEGREASVASPVRDESCDRLGFLPGDAFRIVAQGGRAQEKTMVYSLKRQKAEFELPRWLEFSGQGNWRAVGRAGTQDI